MRTCWVCASCGSAHIRPPPFQAQPLATVHTGCAHAHKGNLSTCLLGTHQLDFSPHARHMHACTHCLGCADEWLAADATSKILAWQGPQPFSPPLKHPSCHATCNQQHSCALTHAKHQHSPTAPTTCLCLTVTLDCHAQLSCSTVTLNCHVTLKCHAQLSRTARA